MIFSQKLLKDFHARRIVEIGHRIIEMIAKLKVRMLYESNAIIVKCEMNVTTKERD